MSVRIREVWNDRKARVAAKRRGLIEQRTRAAVKREMARQQLSQWDIDGAADARLLEMLDEPGNCDDPA